MSEGLVMARQHKRIKELQAEVERLKDALRHEMECCSCCEDGCDADPGCGCTSAYVLKDKK